MFAKPCVFAVTMNPGKTQGRSEKRTSEEIRSTSDRETENFNAVQYSLQILHHRGNSYVK